MTHAHAGLVGTLALLLVGCARGPNVTSDQLPLRRVVVYRNGVAYFERAGQVEADRVTFKMRGRMVGDFLATLAIVERGGSTVRAASFPLEVDRQDDVPEVDPSLRSMLKPWPEPPPRRDPDALREVVLTLDGKRHDLAVGYVSETPVWRPSYRLVIRPGGAADLQAWGIVQNLSGEDWNDVSLALVAGAPLAFESTLGDPVIPQRPVVSDTGEVIAAVPEGVTSLDATVEAAPEEERDLDGDMPMAEPAADEAKDGSRRSRRGPVGGAPAPAAPPPPPMPKGRPDNQEQARRESVSQPRNLSSLAGVAVDAGTTRYEVPVRISVPNDSATMVLLVSRQVPGEAVFLYAPDGGVPASFAHPFRVVRFRNATKGLLERGPIAVFERGSFLGQGVVESLPPGATATVPFAVERGLAVQHERKFSEQGARLVRIESGELTIERDTVTETTYTLKNGLPEPAKLLVKHPRTHGARLHAPPKGTEDNVGTGHALIPGDVRGGGKVTLVVDEREARERREDWLSERADDAVKAFLADPKSGAAMVATLTDAWKVRGALKTSRDRVAALETEQAELERMTRETRFSLKAIEDNRQALDLRAKLTKRLAEGTTRLEQITKELIELKMAVGEQEIRFRDALRGITYARPPEPRP